MLIPFKISTMFVDIAFAIFTSKLANQKCLQIL